MQKKDSTKGRGAQRKRPTDDDFSTGERLDLNRHLVKHPDATFFVRVAGDSMTGAGIHPGDILVVDRAIEPQNGQIVIAVLDGELTVKRISRREGRLYLVPDNCRYQPLEILEEMEFEVWGVVTAVVHELPVGKQKPATKKRESERAAREGDEPARVDVTFGEGQGCAAFNIRAGDTLTMELADERELRDGELIGVCPKGKAEWEAFGRVVKDFGDERDAKGYGLRWATGGCQWCDFGKYTPFRVARITRTIIPEVVPDGDGPTGKIESIDEMEAKLEELRSRLERVSQSDDITDCTARFALEKQIYDLEREIEREARADEWAELIGA